MAKEEIHVGDVGTVFTVTVKDGSTVVDISTATAVKNLLFKKPDNSVVTKAATFVTDGVNGKLQYTAEAGFLDLAGAWSMQVYLELTAGMWHSDVGAFQVHSNLE